MWGRLVFKAVSNSSTSYAAANIDAKALGRYLRRSTMLELPSKPRQAILPRLENTVGPKGPGTPDPATTEASPGGEHFRAVTLNFRRGLAGKVRALGSRLRGWGYPDLVGL